jgi:hypothetical protein
LKKLRRSRIKGGKGDIALMYIDSDIINGKIEKVTLDYLSINTTMDFKNRIKDTISPLISFGPRFTYSRLSVK